MKNNVESLYDQYIEPLGFSERILMIQRILKDFVQIDKKDNNLQTDCLKSSRKFKGN